MRYCRCSVRWRFVETSADYILKEWWRTLTFLFILKALYLEGDRCQEGGEEYWRCFSAVRRGTILDWVPSVPSVVCAGWAGLPLTLGSHHTQSYSILCCKLLACCYQLYIIKTFDLLSIMNHVSVILVVMSLWIWRECHVLMSVASE